MTIEAVREQGKPTAVTWDYGLWRLRLVDGQPVAETRFGTEWFLNQHPYFDKAVIAYRILKEGLEPPEGFTVEYEGGRIIRVQRDDGFFVARRRSDNGMWEVPRGTYTAEEVGQLAPILAEIAEQEAES